MASVPGVWTAAPRVSASSLYVRLFLFTIHPFCEVSVHLLAWSPRALNVLSPRPSDQGTGFCRSLDLGGHGHLLCARSGCGSLGHCCPTVSSVCCNPSSGFTFVLTNELPWRPALRTALEATAPSPEGEVHLPQGRNPKTESWISKPDNGESNVDFGREGSFPLMWPCTWGRGAETLVPTGEAAPGARAACGSRRTPRRQGRCVWGT